MSRYKEKSFGESVADTWHFFVDELAPVFFVAWLIIASVVGLGLLIAWAL